MLPLIQEKTEIRIHTQIYRYTHKHVLDFIIKNTQINCRKGGYLEGQERTMYRGLRQKLDFFVDCFVDVTLEPCEYFIEL